MGLRAAVQLVDHDAHKALVAGNVGEFFSYIYANEDMPHWIDDTPLDLDRTWHVIHFLVTGDKSTTLLLDGLQVPSIDEHLESHSKASIAKLYCSLRGRTASELLGESPITNLNDANIYDTTWDESTRPFLLEKLSEFIEKIATAKASERGLFVSIR